MMQTVKFPRFRGFTLVELLIVMGIIGLLVVLGASNFRTARMKARDVERKTDLAAVSKALEAYVNDHSRYPTSTATGTIQCQTGTACPWNSAFTDGTTTYLPQLPGDDYANRYYRYETLDGGITYYLYTILENTRDPAIQTYPGKICSTTNEVCNYRIKSSNAN